MLCCRDSSCCFLVEVCLDAFNNLLNSLSWEQCRWAEPEISVLEKTFRFGTVGRELTLWCFLCFATVWNFALPDFWCFPAKLLSFEKEKRHQISFPVFLGQGLKSCDSWPTPPNIRHYLKTWEVGWQQKHGFSVRCANSWLKKQGWLLSCFHPASVLCWFLTAVLMKMVSLLIAELQSPPFVQNTEWYDLRQPELKIEYVIWKPRLSDKRGNKLLCTFGEKKTLKIQTVKRKALGEEIQLKEHICFKFLFGAKSPHICFCFKFACVLLSLH